MVSSKLGILGLIFICCSFFSRTNAQPVDIRQIRISGGNINFIANTYDKYANGIDYPIQTRLTITYRVDDVLGWELWAWADNPEFLSDNGETIPLEALELQFDFVSNDGDLNEDFVLKSEDFKDLLASGTGGASDPSVVINLTVSYSIGKSEDYRLMNREEGFYFVNLYFELVRVLPDPDP
jgi:hypothetical protein